MEGRGRDGENAPNQPNIEKNRKGVSGALQAYYNNKYCFKSSIALTLERTENGSTREDT